MLGESCNDCVHFIRYPKGEVTCLMRQEFCMIKGKRTYPINCEYYETGVSNKDKAKEIQSWINKNIKYTRPKKDKSKVLNCSDSWGH